MLSEEQKKKTDPFPGILQIRERKEAEAFYLSKSANKTICGLFVRTKTPLEKGVRVLTVVDLPKAGDPILVDCEVIWVNANGNGKPPGMAVKFVSIAEKDRRALDVYFRPSKPNN